MEYALIVAAVGLALITTVNQLSQGIVSLYQSITGRPGQHRHSGRRHLEGEPVMVSDGAGPCSGSSPCARLGVAAPDLALVAASVTLFYCLFLFQGYRKLFRDSDAGWHIRTGERILATGQLPRTDPYSFTRAGQPWFAWEWALRRGRGRGRTAPPGLTGVALFYGMVIAAAGLALVPAALGGGGQFPGGLRRWRRCCSPPAASTGWRGRM